MKNIELEKIWKTIEKIKYCEGCNLDGGICECGDEKFVVDIRELKRELKWE